MTAWGSGPSQSTAGHLSSSALLLLLSWELASHRCRRALGIRGLLVQPTQDPQISRWLWAGEGEHCISKRGQAKCLSIPGEH